MKHVTVLLATVAVAAGSLGTPTGAAVAAPAADRPPVARADRLVTSEDTTITYSGDGVLSNDRDPEGRRLRARLVRGPRHGTARLARDGRLVYDPDRNWSGRDVLVYLARDPGGRRDRARVVVRVRPVNDAPRVRMRAQTPVPEGGTSEVTLTARDVEGDTLTYAFDCDGDGTFEVEQDTGRHDCPVGEPGTVRVQGRVVDARGAATTVGIDVVVVESGGTPVRSVAAG